MDVDTDFDGGATYKGKVKAFRPNCWAKVTPDADLSSVGVGAQGVQISASDILTTESPAFLAKEQEVEFKLRKDEWGVYGHSLTGPGGSAIGPPAEVKERKPPPARTAVNGGQRYSGKVKTYLWPNGFGYLIFDEPEAFNAPEITNAKEKKKFDKTKAVWFARDDILSTDAAVGLHKDEAVQFSVYTDEKGIGATQITRPDGTAFSGVRNDLYRGPPKPKRKKKKKGKQNQQQGFGPMKGNMMMMPMGGFNPMMNMMMGGGMPMMMGGGGQQMGGGGGMQMMMMNGQPYMMMPVGGKKKKNKKKSKWTKEEREQWNAQKKAEKAQ